DYANANTGGTVNVAFDGDLHTTGSQAHGIMAQSVGGGGGILLVPAAQFAGSVSSQGIAKDVTVKQSGSLVASGANAFAIVAQSDAGLQTGAITVDISGDVQGGSEDGGGVWMSGGTPNNSKVTIQNGASLSALSNLALRYDTRSQSNEMAIDNYGLISGDITCSTSQDAPGCQLNNHQEGIATGAQQYKANVHNDGQLIVNRPGEFQPLTIMGEFTQSSTGSLSGINVDFDQKRSSLVSIQNQASLDGSV